MFHYHNYDRKYYVQGKKDKYYSESLVAKAEREVILGSKLSFGLGSEYKYDWGHYLTKTFASQTRGHLSNFGIFGNAGYKFNENQILSLHGRNDDHKETGGNKTYKVNFTQILGPFKLGATHSTGLKNASLYELYGNTGQKSINPEKSETNELYGEYNFSENIKFSSTAYRTRMKDRIKIKSDWSAYENKIPDTTQEGLESEISFLANNQEITFFSHFAKSRTASGGPNSRRPDLSYGVDFSKDGLRLVAGAPTYNGNNGVVRVYDWNGSNAWIKIADITDSVDNSGSTIGRSVSITEDGQTIIAGAVSGNNTGHVLVFENEIISGISTWTLKATIAGDAASDGFGYSSAISGNGSKILIGAIDAYGGANARGYYKLFSWDGNTAVSYTHLTLPTKRIV